ncbi:hypothetical protein KSP39_PZI000202 [Platanthera zijinensis]|uniref:Reverse transcriptase domain-containing protein n=1 Tax=Platanthera zijinensis TaxID=2320716 RepID=A0AAP0GES6_9ASPA
MSADQTKTLIHKVKELKNTLGRLQTWWRQQAKVRWLTEGDSNTAYFHSMASNRRRCNRINQVLDLNGELTEDPTTIEATFLHFFEQKWLHVNPSLDGWPSLADKPTLSTVARHSLLRPVTEDDLWNAVKSMKPNRSPGADGITSSFLTHFWSLVKTDVCSAMLDFFALGVMDPSWKETLVVLLPKSLNANSPELFRPISLCSIFYKIVAKLLVQRLQHILPSLISEEQSAFVSGRQISHQCFLAQEILHKFRFSTAKAGFMALKIDMTQAYDKMCWATLLKLLHGLQFPPQFIGWIMQCISSPSFSLLLNGLRSRPIVAARGFQQGCPLSPYLFILCSELLSLAFQQHGSELGIALSSPGPRISHLLYADDILIFSEASTIATNKVWGILDSYCAWTGQSINAAKSFVLFNNATPQWKKTRLTRLIGFPRVEEFTYLGIKLALRKLHKADYADIIRKAHSQIQAWGSHHLSLAGRAVLINHSLLASSAYIMSHALVPKGVLDALELAARSFLWQRSANARGMHYVDWASLCRPRNCGGLGFHATVTWSGPLRARFAWEYLQPHQSLFVRAMHGRYSENLFTCPARRSDSAVIKILRDGAASLLSVSRWRIGRGENINILADRWIQDRVFARLPTFIHSQLPDSMLLSEMLTEDGEWNRSKLLQFFGPSLVDTIMQIPTYPAVGRDRLELNFQHSGKTIASMAYAACFPSPSADFSWLSRLGLRPRERLFWWHMALDAIPTRCWLLRRGLTDSGLCPWGCPSPENRDHIMRGCSNVAAISRELH